MNIDQLSNDNLAVIGVCVFFGAVALALLAGLLIGILPPKIEITPAVPPPLSREEMEAMNKYRSNLNMINSQECDTCGYTRDLGVTPHFIGCTFHYKKCPICSDGWGHHEEEGID